MSWQRLIHRNQLLGDYTAGLTYTDLAWTKQMIAGDARRMERDQRDARHLARYAEVAGITSEQARIVLDLFLDNDCEGQTYPAPYLSTSEVAMSTPTPDGERPPDPIVTDSAPTGTPDGQRPPDPIVPPDTTTPPDNSGPSRGGRA